MPASRPPYARLHDLLDHAADEAPEQPAVADTEAAWSYAELRAASRRFANWLTRRGVRPGDRVVVRSANSPRLAAIVFGTSMAGAVLVPLGHETTPFRFRQVVEDSSPALVLTGPGTEPEPAELAVDEVWPAVAASDAAPPPLRRCPDDTVLLMYTSGSTAGPKGVVTENAALLFAVEAIAERLRYRREDRVLLRLPMSFDYGLYQLFLCTLARATLYLARTETTLTLLRDLRAWAPTVVPLVPALAGLLARLAGRGSPALPPVRLFTNTGDRLGRRTADELRRLFPGSSVVLMYGITECKRVSIGEPDEYLVREGSLGRPLTGTEILILDGEGNALPPRRVGEIAVRGPHVMGGYWRAEEETARRFRTVGPSGVRELRTGDFGYLDGEGRLYFEGRGDDLFKRHGVRTSTAEIEAAAEDVPLVSRAVALPDAADGELWLVVGGPVAPEDVLRAVGARLEPQKRPDRCMVLDALPLTANGKIDRLRVAAAVGAAVRRGASGPRPTE
ncbi:class I adenylate-forming enzyme family protein [Streptomyces sulphureus]|uniref:class I adenylate-forming enzyme family protein n=1 Tax=Streptomyces sulphureus TaxID=47758 RepID=UPI00037F4870|nr:class I adenylate-forming enzyme family protein [Streptomyces sulphureus]